MEIKSRFDHYNINVLDLQKSLDFYEKALGLKEVRRKESSDGSFILVYIGDNTTGFTLELTWLRDWDRPYKLGDNEQHLCVRVENDYDQTRSFHKENGWVCYENEKMGLYFINDPDGYWIEILPLKR
jgi:lactoylglutathione lyase